MSHQNFDSVPSMPFAVAPAKRPFFKKKRFVIPAGVLLLGIVMGSCSSGSKPVADSSPIASAAASAAPAEAAAQPAAAPPSAVPAPAAPAAPAVGTPFTVKMRNGDAARITIVTAMRTDAVTTTAFATPPKNGSYLLLDVLWETEAGKTSSNPLYFSAKDASGRKADLNMFADDQLGSGDVLPGDKSRGFIAFDIAPGTATVIISDPLLQEAARIQIPG
ncbi:hypothetical protein [Pseudarthrobacter sp. AB1]|uniref:hypothetical protein n=1 Tax=Pseudarthrobacter sp. AB1 TaxID=2138309 RepID=UPI00186B8950|nr:hypothetical protein [Pseudarthrobacter sp. AB1]MBE4719884.1 hypothetical protein [Pseudarthrobacter sp. AB1]